MMSIVAQLFNLGPRAFSHTNDSMFFSPLYLENAEKPAIIWGVPFEMSESEYE